MEHWHGEGEAGFSSAAFTVEGPLTKDRTAVMLSARSSLGDALNQDLLAYNAAFGDFHLKLTHQLNRNNKLLISGYTGNDRLQLTGDNNGYLQKWNNGLFTINWNLLTGKRSFVNTTMNVSSFDNYVALKYQYTNTGAGSIPLYKTTAFNNYASGKRYEAKTVVEITASPHLRFLFGGLFEQATILPYTTLVTMDFDEDNSHYSAKRALSFYNAALWYENEVRVGNNFLLRAGLHANAYSMSSYNHQSLQPRFFASYKLDDQQQLNFSYSHTSQVLHSITSPYPGINREIWFPANNNFQPVLGKMINLGYEYKNKHVINFSADIYYKTIEHLVNFSTTTNILFYNDSIENKFITGTGKSYGVELVAERKFNQFKTLLSYTLSWSWRRFDSLQNGQWQPYRYDRRHSLNWLFSYQPDNSVELSLLWHFHTGDWITVPTAIPSNPEETMNKTDPGSGAPAFQPYRAHVFNRVNVNATCYLKSKKKISQKINAGVHIMDHSPDEYRASFSATDNKDYTVDLFPNQLFKYSWYVSYNIRF
jgi:hypothetical protein